MRAVILAMVLLPSLSTAQKYSDGQGRLRVALAKQPFSPNGTSQGPTTMASAS